ncbi:hypothetical protein ACVW0Y_002063 [Pseudomonas sp. TE3786]
MAKFAVRARAVDMLGRQQIAGIPTAIHELFKNAHDAYATRVEADFIRSERLLVIRDNGLGMTLDDFQNKWLALGTESKVGANESLTTTWTGPHKLPHRPVLGEKGIGRLAIATIAPITFAMSRAIRPDGAKKIVAALVCWELFEIPGLNIADIEIPVEEFSGLPNAEDIHRMRDQIIANTRALIPENEKRCKEIIERLESFDLDPRAYDEWLGEASPDEENLSLTADGFGTHFYLVPTDTILDADIDEDKQIREAPPLKRMLLGFGNSMQPKMKPPITAEFRDHKPSGIINELIGLDNFFKAEDLNKADHLFDGRFDDFGQFVGTLQIYQGESEPYVLSWSGNAGKQTDCGPFSVRLAAVQGLRDETLLDTEAHSEMMDKLWRYGGFYVYRDGIRILPYGQSDYDWLKIENRRTLSARDWFFSHRRMIGYVAIESTTNKELIEKAGREGFRENKAFRQFRAILENWLQQLAKDYFRKEAEHGGEFREKRNELKSQAALIERRKAQVAGKRKEFKAELVRILDLIDANKPDSDLKEILESLKTNLYRLTGVFPEIIRADALRLENEAYRAVDQLEQSLSLNFPRTFSPKQTDREAYENYAEWLEDFRTSKLEPARSNIAERLASFRAAHNIGVHQRERAAAALDLERSEAMKQLRSLKNETESELKLVDNEIRSILKERFSSFKTAVEEVMVDLNKADLDGISSAEAFKQQRALELRINEKLESQRQTLDSLLKQLQGLRADIADQTTPEETTAALESKIADLEGQLALYNDLAQAGSAVGIIGHEMENVVGGIREALREIKPWADGTPGLDEAYEKLRLHFDHIDGYLALFAPLSRRMRRKKANISGKMILRYIRDAFGDRLTKSEIELIVTNSFEQFELESYASTIMATFVNIIDNAIYWIDSSRHSERWIKLDATPDGFEISNGGPGVPIRIARQVFEFGVSMKPDGRGMGLSVSRDALNSIGLQLSLETQGSDTNPTFRISHKNKMAMEGSDD